MDVYERNSIFITTDEIIIKSNFHFKKMWEFDIYTHVSSEVSCTVAAPCNASYDWTQNVWGTSGSIVSVSKVHYLCDIVAVIFGLGKFLVGRHEYINKRLYPTCLFGKGALECYKSLKEGLGNMLLHMKLFTYGWIPLRMAGKRQMMPIAVESQHRWQMNATWNKWNLSLNIHTVFHVRQLLQKLESLQQVFIVTNSLGKWLYAKWIPHVLSNDQRATFVLLASTQLQH